MTSDDIKQAWKVPEPTLKRLLWYLALVKSMKGKGGVFILSTQITEEINVDPSQVVESLSPVDIFGKTRVGYDINALIDILGNSLGFISQHKAFLFEVGSLGASLLHDIGLSQYGLKIMAGLDAREDLDESMISDIPVLHMNDFPTKQREYGATIGVITVPVEGAQEVTDRIIEGGVKALWNFTPFRIRASEHTVTQNISMCAHLAVMFS